MIPQPNAPIVFFDGVCNLCNHAVDFWISRLSGRLSDCAPLVLLQFASLQGETAKRMIGNQVDLGTPLSAAFFDGDLFQRRQMLRQIHCDHQNLPGNRRNLGLS